MSRYTTLSNYGNCTCLLKIKTKMKIGCFAARILDNLWAFFKETIIPLALVRCEMIIVSLPSHIQRALVESFLNILGTKEDE